MALIDWAYYKAKAELPDDNLKTMFEALINAASAAIYNYCRRDFIETEYTEEYDGDGKSVLFLRQTPVTEVSEVKINDAVQDADAWVWKADGRLALVSDTPSLRILGAGTFSVGTQNIEITYKAGYASIPEDVKNACAQLTTFFYNRDRMSGIASKSSKNQTVQYDDVPIPSPIRAVLNRYYNFQITAV